VTIAIKRREGLTIIDASKTIDLLFTDVIMRSRLQSPATDH
jgi:hypothetical protein